MNGITRIETGTRLSKIVIHNGIVYVSGLTAANRDGDAKVQTEDILAQLGTWLKEAGTDSTRLLSAQVWVADMARDFNLMNTAWEAWLPAAAAPVRATTEAALASPAIRVEIMVTAALV
jgi:enamine deaminase RidA (YjgF/YER057c/UK114 family)